MKIVSSKLIGYGVLICALGVLLQRIGTDLVSLIFGSLAQPNAVMEFILNFVIAVLQFGAAPFGAVLAAIGVAIRMIESNKSQQSSELGASSSGDSKTLG